VVWVCPASGGHTVSQREVQQRDVQRRPLCPTHGVAMKQYPGAKPR
jgi:hypothetical protein